jgi:hypothetical protein
LERMGGEEVAKLRNCRRASESVSWNDRMTSPPPSRQLQEQAPWSPRVFAAIAFAALLGILPLLIKGNVAGHDLQFHISSWSEVAQQWRHGIVLPRWAAGANYGYGEPRFIFYPPLSWLLGGLLALWLPVRALPTTFCSIGFFAAGCGMFALARRYLSQGLAIAAAMLYALNPYHLITVYWDFRIAEMLASAIFPVVILYALECEEGWSKTAGLAVSIAGVWLANAPAAVMLMYSLALLLCVLAFMQRSARLILHGAAGIVLGIGLAAFYFVPAAYEQSWVNILGVFGSGLTPRENFLFSIATDPPHTYFNFLVSGIALEEAVLFAFAAIVAIRSLRKSGREAWAIAIAAIGALAALMMFRISAPLWSLPKMQFVQFPWRWMLVVNLALVVLAIVALRNARSKWIWAIAILAFLGYTERGVIRHATWGRRAVAEMYWSTSTDGYRGAKEYLPMEVHRPPKPYVLPETPIAELKCEIPCPQDALTIERWAEEEKRLAVKSAVPAAVTLKLFDYPAWSVEMDGRAIPHETTYGGAIVIPIPPGKHELRVVFTRTPDRTAGIAISIFSGLILVVLLSIGDDRKLVQQPPQATETSV